MNILCQHQTCCLWFSGLDVSESYIVVQYYIEPGIDVYDRKNFKHLFRLSGHEYGGQCLKILEHRHPSTLPEQDESELPSHKSLLYSASMDCSLKSWNLEKQCLIDTVTDHCDYVQSLTTHRRWPYKLSYTLFFFIFYTTCHIMLKRNSGIITWA